MLTNNVAFVLFTGNMLAGIIGNIASQKICHPQASFHKKIATLLPPGKVASLLS